MSFKNEALDLIGMCYAKLDHVIHNARKTRSMMESSPASERLDNVIAELVNMKEQLEQHNPEL